MANLTPHINAEIGDFAKTVLMPGDPKRAKLIAEKYLENARLVTDVRGIVGYTGFYKGKELSVMASGMGIPSMGIYSYELFHVFGVENIIRIGSCGSYSKDLNLLDLILVDKTYNEGNYALTTNNEDCHLIEGNLEINGKLEEKAKELNKRLVKGTTVCSEAFYMTDVNQFFQRVPEGINLLGVEMEAFALLYNAKILNKKAACILTVTDGIYFEEQLTSEQREKSLDNMIELALETAIEL
ncbi:MAG: purine-nucleoside phosphorylase [Clostridia bacterium]|nr:purine-nucleoside phosphorylase [Clostridia bacterium]